MATDWLDHALAAFEPDEDPYRTDPVGWVAERLGEQLWSRQRAKWFGQGPVIRHGV